MEVVLKVTPVSAAGSATSDLPVTGFIEAIFVDYTSQAATTDVTITEVEGLQRTLLALINTNADTTAYPLIQATDTAGAALTSTYSGIYVSGVHLKATVAQGSDIANGVVVRILVSGVTGG